MVSFSRILVGVDLSHADRLVSEHLSEHCENAVNRAIALAKASGGSITFMAVLDISEQALHLIQSKESPAMFPVEDDAGKVLQTLVDRATAQGVTSDYAVGFGPTSTQILQKISDGNYTLLVIGGRSKNKLSEFLFGRTSTKLIRKSPVPVLIAKHCPSEKIESLLVADDFSDNAMQVLSTGVDLARMSNIGLHVIHVLEPTDDAKLVAAGVPVEDLLKIQTAQTDQANATLNDRLAQTDFRTLETGVKTHVEFGKPEEVIARTIEDLEIDVLILGTVGRSGLSALMLGNTAERLLSAVACSLLTIKPESAD